MTDPIADMLTRIRNGQMVKKKWVECLTSKLKIGVLKVLKKEGYIEKFESIAEGHGKLRIFLKYYHGKPVIKTVRKVSKPGQRVYRSYENFPKVYNGLGISVVSTSKGLFSDGEAKRQKVGGEVLCTVA